MHTQFAGRIEQEDKGATADQAALTQVRPDEMAEQVVLVVDPADQFSIRGRAVRGLILVASIITPG